MIKLKSTYLILLLVLVGCAELKVMSENASRPKNIKGESCLESPRLTVLQVIDDGILGYICPIDYPSYYSGPFEACTQGDLVFMYVNPKQNNYVDDQKITLSQSQCFVEDGIFKYIAYNKMKRTVRKIKILVNVSN